MATSAPPTELVLKFSCPSCGHRLTMPVRKAGTKAPCPKCTHQVVAPPIDSSVSGYEAIAASIRAAVTPTHPPAAPGSHITLEDDSVVAPPVQPPQGKPYIPPRPASPPPPNNATSTSQRSPQPPPIPPPPVKEIADELPASPYTAPIADPVVGRTHRSGFAFPWRARWTWWLIYIGILYAFATLSVETRVGFFGFLGACWLFLGPYLTTQVLMPLVYPSFTCPGCHEIHEAVGYWNCACGYVPHRVKHLFHKCPECGERGGKTKCPRCGVSMLIW